MIFGFYSSTHQVQRAKPEPETKHHKGDAVSGGGGGELGVGEGLKRGPHVVLVFLSPEAQAR